MDSVVHFEIPADDTAAAGAVVVMPKMQAADMGLYARIKDTEGNVIGIWQDLKK